MLQKGDEILKFWNWEIGKLMNARIFIIALIYIGCNDPADRPSSQKPDSAAVAVKSSDATDKKFLYATTDSVIIGPEHFGTIVYSKEEFNEIVDNFPTLYETIPVKPEISYAQSGYFKDIPQKDGTKKHLSFGSEVGQDEYYILYSYFLKKQNQSHDLDTVRETLIGIFRDINDIFKILRNGGTFFGHQYSRISGHVEYSVYLHKKFQDYYTRLPDIKEQKKLYIKTLQQIILDEINADSDLYTQILKEKKKKVLVKYVEHLNSLLSNNFYLKNAQEFQYSYY
jgi:hypothetical protein